MKKLLFMTICLLSLLAVSSASAAILFQQNMNTNDVYIPAGQPNSAGHAWNFNYYAFGARANTYSGVVWNSTGGVNGTGALHVPLPGLTNFNCFLDVPVNTREAYIRWYYKVSPGFNTAGDDHKVFYLYSTPFASGSRSGFVMTTANPDGAGHGLYLYATDPGQWNTERGDGTGWHQKDQNVPTFYFENYQNQWVCFEVYWSMATKNFKLWITTPDGRFKDTLYMNTYITQNPAATMVTNMELGAFFNGTGNSSLWYEMDEVVVSTTKIGPLGSVTPPPSEPPPPPPPPVTDPDNSSSKPSPPRNLRLR